MAALAGKTIAITGGAGGIGRALAPMLLEQGARLLLIDPNEAALARVTADLEAGDRVVTVASTIDSLKACAGALSVVPGPIHALVHLAGVFEPDPEGADDHGVWDRAIASNLTNAYDMAFACVPRLDPGSVCRMVFISSLAFRRGAFDHVPYTVPKAASPAWCARSAGAWRPARWSTAWRPASSTPACRTTSSRCAARRSCATSRSSAGARPARSPA